MTNTKQTKQTTNKKVQEPTEERVHEPDPKFKRFFLKRKQDISGVSGVGYVAEGIQFSNGVCVLQWTTETASLGIYHSHIELIHIHGHLGLTQIEFLDV
jgi:hypothetical protein